VVKNQKIYIVAWTYSIKVMQMVKCLGQLLWRTNQGRTKYEKKVRRMVSFVEKDFYPEDFL